MIAIAQDYAGTFDAVKSHSTFGFSVKHMMVATFRATFDDVDARIIGTPDGLKLDGAARVESLSIRMPADFRNHVLYAAEFFDARRHPEITFASDDIQPVKDGSVRVRGMLTIKGISVPFVAVGKYYPVLEDPFGRFRTAAELTAFVDRRSWDMNWQVPLPRGGHVLGYDVRIDVAAEFIKTN